MADVPIEDENDDNWLYGDSTELNTTEDQDKQDDEAPPGDEEPPPGEDQGEDNEQEEGAGDPGHNLTGHLDDEHFDDQLDGVEQENEDGVNQNGEGQQENGDSDSDDSEDDVKVILGDTKTQPAQAYTNLNIKRGNLIVQPNLEKQKQTGKFSTEDFESVGNINGVPAQEFNVDVLEDKPWRKPGADITDYFNYGFTEDTWRAYCERQKRMRVHESGTGLIPLGGKDLNSGGVNTQQLRQLTPISSEHANKYVPPPITPNRKPSNIDVLSRRDGDENMSEPPPPISPMGIPPPISHNTIQVMTADRRGYGRGKPFPDMTLPPPAPEDFFHQPPEQPPFYPPYEEPWGSEQGGGWAPGDIKELTPGPMHIGPPPGMVGPPGMGPPPMNMGPPPMGHPPMMIRPPMGQPPHMGPGPNMPPYGPPPGHMEHPRDRERDRDRERELRERERERDYRERDHRERDRDRDMDPDDKDIRESSEMRDRERERSRTAKPDRHREKSHRRERSRSRSRRHKSRSRSPSSRHRSKKKSHHKDKDDSD